MPLHRIRARVRYPNSSGMAQWCYDQMVSRHAMAVHIKVGTDAAEEPVNEVINVGQGNRDFVCDLPLMDEAHAIDAFATLTAASVIAIAVAIAGEDGPGFVERHTCYHNESLRQPCVVNQYMEVPAL